MKNIPYIILLVLTSMSFFSCDDQTSIEGGGRVYATMTISPAFNYPLEVGHILCNSAFKGSSQNNSSFLQTDESSVTKGQNVNVSGQVYTPSGGCKDITIKLYHNGNVVRTENYTMGGGGSNYSCGDGVNVYINWIVP